MSFGNPRTPEEAKHEFYLVPADMKLRYAPQYAEIRLNDLQEAQLVESALRSRGVLYKIYDKHGVEQETWDV